MAKPNFSFQKRQKELARQKKQEEKKQRKLEKSVERSQDGSAIEAGGVRGEDGAPQQDRQEI